MSAMIQPISPAVHWFEGMLLSPQHFQQNHLHLEQMMFHQLQRLNPHYFGFLQLSIDKISLADNMVRITKLHAIMPDGSVVHCQSNPTDSEHDSEQLLELNLNDIEQPAAMKPFFIHLALAKHKDRNKYENSDEGSNELTRYNMTKDGLVKDLHDRDNRVDVARLELKLQLLTEEQKNSNYTVLPLLKLQRRHDGSYEFLDYTPPCLQINPKIADTPAQSKLWNKIESLLARLRTKAIEKRDYFNGGNKSPLTFSQKQELLLLTQYLPKLRIMLNSNTCHPYEFYLALIEMSAGMSMLLGDGLASDYHDYDHQALNKIFEEPIKDITALVNQLELNFEVVNFEQNKQHGFYCELKEQAYSGCFMLSLRLATGVSREQLTEWMENAYICAEDQQKNLLKQRVLGLKRDAVLKFEEIGIEESEDELLFTVEVDDDFFPRTSHPTLFIHSSEGKLNKYKPSAISCYRKRDPKQ